MQHSSFCFFFCYKGISLFWISYLSLFQYLVFELKCSFCWPKLTFVFKVERTLVALPDWSVQCSFLFDFDLFVNQNRIMCLWNTTLSRMGEMGRLLLHGNNCTCIDTHVKRTNNSQNICHCVWHVIELLMCLLWEQVLQRVMWLQDTC